MAMEQSTALIKELHAASSYEKQLAWKQHGQRKLLQKAQQLNQAHERECTFKPNINTPRRSSAIPSGPVKEQDKSQRILGRSTSNIETGTKNAVQTTEAQVSSIQLHLARQQKAKENAKEAQDKMLSVQPLKDFSKVTQVKPFTLGIAKRPHIRRSNSESPKRGIRVHQRPQSMYLSTAPIAATVLAPVNPPTGTQRPKSNTVVSPRSKQIATTQRPTSKSTTPKGSTTRSRASSRENVARTKSAVSTTASKTTESQSIDKVTWEKERSTLLGIIESQRQELDLRDKMQQEALKAAEHFANAIQMYEERLVAIETKSQLEIQELKRLVLKQGVATDVILQALGIPLASGNNNHTTSGGTGGHNTNSSTTNSISEPYSSTTTTGVVFRRDTKMGLS